MKWLDGASSLLAALPALSIVQHSSEQLTHMLRYAPYLQHLCARMHKLPKLYSLPHSLETLTLGRPWVRQVHMPGARLQSRHPLVAGSTL